MLLGALVHELPEGARVVRAYSTGSAGLSVDAQLLARLVDELRCLRVDVYRAVMLYAGAKPGDLPDYPPRVLDADPMPHKPPPPPDPEQDRARFLQAIGGVTFVSPAPPKG